MMSKVPLTLYSMQRSMNCYKVRLALAHLDQSFVLKDVDILRGDTRTPEFLTINPHGRVPVLEIEPGRYLAESNAILLYLAKGSDLVPRDRLERAYMLQWMFFEQNTHEPAIGVARFWLALVRGGRELKRDLIDDWMERGEAALSIMDQHLEKNPFFAGATFSLADITLYANTHVAEEAGFSLQNYSHVCAWLARVNTLSRHVTADWQGDADKTTKKS